MSCTCQSHVESERQSPVLQVCGSTLPCPAPCPQPPSEAPSARPFRSMQPERVIYAVIEGSRYIIIKHELRNLRMQWLLCWCDECGVIRCHKGQKTTPNDNRANATYLSLKSPHCIDFLPDVIPLYSISTTTNKEVHWVCSESNQTSYCDLVSRWVYWL